MRFQKDEEASEVGEAADAEATGDVGGTGQEAQNARLGEMISAVFDEALRVTADPKRAAELASRVVSRILLLTGNRAVVERLSSV